MSVGSKLWNLLAFGTLGPVDDSGPVQTAQVGVGYMETQDARPVVTTFGLASNPPAGADVVVLYQGGDRSKGLVIGHGHQASRPRGQKSGETTLYNAGGISVYLANTGLVINGGGLPVTIENAPTVAFAGPLVTIQGTLAVSGVILLNGISVEAP